MSEPSVLSSRATVDTELSACSAEFSPFDGSVLACGLYQILKEDDGAAQESSSPATRRHGRCLLYNMVEDGSLTESARLDLPAILDMKWSHQEANRLAVATSVGLVKVLEVGKTQQLSALLDIQVAPSDVLCLSLDWNNRLRTDAAELVVSLSDGSCAIVDVASGSVSEQWHAHDFEPWIAAWDYWQPACIWTGGDDCVLKVWDRRAGFEQPIAKNKRFDGGVTTISSHHLAENIFAVGSYDSNLRIFDKRSINRPLSEAPVGGGVWRARWHPVQTDRLLVACMHDGFKTMRCSSDWSQLRVESRLDEHESLAYGADWTQQSGGDSTTAATCSFYDHTLKLWHV